MDGYDSATNMFRWWHRRWHQKEALVRWWHHMLSLVCSDRHYCSYVVIYEDVKLLSCEVAKFSHINFDTG